MHMASQNKILDVSSEFDDFSLIGGCRSAEEASVCKTAVWLAEDVKALYQETRFYFFSVARSFALLHLLTCSAALCFSPLAPFTLLFSLLAHLHAHSFMGKVDPLAGGEPWM